MDRDSDISSLSREEIEEELHRLKVHNIQLRNLLSKRNGCKKTKTSHRKLKAEKLFDFAKFSKRHIALKFLYLGWNRRGFAVQEDTANTVEAELFQALLKTKLIESRETSNYHRCGRTDKGVSAFSQVISITVRSNLTQEEIEEDLNSLSNSMSIHASKELNYAQILNRVLPSDIRILGWCPIQTDFSARFDCSSRTYKYFFPKGSLNLEAMNTAAQLLVGKHDFRNFCKMDVANGVVSFIRRVKSVRIEELNQASCQNYKQDAFFEESNFEGQYIGLVHNDSYSANVSGSIPQRKLYDSNEHEPTDVILNKGQVEHISLNMVEGSDISQDQKSDCDPLIKNIFVKHKPPTIEQPTSGNDAVGDRFTMCVFTIMGNAFLWHQIRAIMTVLLLVGEGKEEPSVVQKLLDVRSVPRKPQYGFANEISLNLFDTSFSGIRWRYSDYNLRSVLTQLESHWAELSIKSNMVQYMMTELIKQCSTSLGESSHASSFCLSEPNRKNYKPLLERDVCSSLEDRVRHFANRKRIDPGILTQPKRPKSDIVN